VAAREAGLADRGGRVSWACPRRGGVVRRVDSGGVARQGEFTAVASDYATVLQTGLDDYLGKILAMRAFYDASHQVDAGEFAIFSKQITQGYEDAMRLVGSPRVSRDQRAEFEREARASGLTDFSIRTWAPNEPMAVSPPRDEYFPILYSTVSSKRTATLGTDLSSDSVRSEATAGRATATPLRPRRASRFAIRSKGYARVSWR
jgi:CHASE1-domain containing sensor protein